MVGKEEKAEQWNDEEKEMGKRDKRKQRKGGKMEKRKREKVEKRKLGKFLCVGFIVCKVIFCANKRFLCEFTMS